MCRLRDIPILRLINKMDRETRDPFDLLDEIEKVLALDTAPVNWPVGRGRDFIGTIDIESGGVRLLDGDAGKTGPLRQMSVNEVAALNKNLNANALSEELALVNDACKKFDLAVVPRRPSDTGFLRQRIEEFWRWRSAGGVVEVAPGPRAQNADKRRVEADENRMTAFVFKIQANMDPNHRDRIAFARVCSGKLSRGMKAKHIRTGKIDQPAGRRSSFSRAIGRWRMKRLPATWSAFRTTARCVSATR